MSSTTRIPETNQWEVKWMFQASPKTKAVAGFKRGHLTQYIVGLGCDGKASAMPILAEERGGSKNLRLVRVLYNSRDTGFLSHAVMHDITERLFSSASVSKYNHYTGFIGFDSGTPFEGYPSITIPVWTFGYQNAAIGYDAIYELSAEAVGDGNVDREKFPEFYPEYYFHAGTEITFLLLRTDEGIACAVWDTISGGNIQEAFEDVKRIVGMLSKLFVYCDTSLKEYVCANPGNWVNYKWQLPEVKLRATPLSNGLLIPVFDTSEKLGTYTPVV
jgi:hypothetical protein